MKVNSCELSIIIAMYNAEKYIRKCLDSICRSDLPESSYEIIVINDGSTDSSPEIAQEYVRCHDNIIYLTQENQGQSVARNYGIRECHGKYIWCVDSDDMIYKNVTSILNIIKKNDDLDIIEFKANLIKENGQIINKIGTDKFEYNTILSGRDAICGGYQPASMWRLFVKKELLFNHNLFFVPGIIHQDAELAYRIYAHASKVMFVDVLLYAYIEHPNSTINSPKKKLKRLLDDIVVIKSFATLAKEYQTDIEMSNTIEQKSKDTLFGLLYTLFRKKKEYSKEGIGKSVIDVLEKEGLYPVKYNYHSFKKNLAITLLNKRKFIL